jgi:hypothetical protein
MSKYGLRKKDYGTFYEAGEVLDSHGGLAIACNMREAASRSDSTIRELAEVLEKLVRFDSADQEDDVQLMLDYADILKSTKIALATATIE